MNEKIAKILNGGSDNFTVKEILIEHIRTSQDFRKDVRIGLKEVSDKTIKNWSFIKALCVGMSAMFTVLLYMIWR